MIVLVLREDDIKLTLPKISSSALYAFWEGVIIRPFHRRDVLMMNPRQLIGSYSAYTLLTSSAK